MSNIQLFENRQVRSHWDAELEKWYFSIVDVVAVLTDSPNPRKYCSVLKTRLKKEGSELATNCSQLKMQSADGKYYKTDVADTEQLLTFSQSKTIARQGGNVAKVAHKELEKQTGKSVISSNNATTLRRLSQKEQQNGE